MKIENGKILEATSAEIYTLYLDREMDNVMSFDEYVMNLEALGVTINNNPVLNGYWTHTYEDDPNSFIGYVTGYSCSECFGYSRNRLDYCPHCGARMK